MESQWPGLAQPLRFIQKVADEVSSEFLVGLGSVATWPLAARAQQPAMPVIGFLHSGTLASYARYAGAFAQGLREAGFVESRNASSRHRCSKSSNARSPTASFLQPLDARHDTGD